MPAAESAFAAAIQRDPNGQSGRRALVGLGVLAVGAVIMLFARKGDARA